MEALEKLKSVTKILREPGGCNWDRAQDESTMRPFLLEEAYEVIDAVNRGNDNDIKEEIGDLLFVVFFYCRLYEEKGVFNLEDAATLVAEKLIRRHPHVFGEEKNKDVESILRNWEKLKDSEKPSEHSASGMDGTPGPAPEAPTDRFSKPFLPALMRAFKVQEKAARVGFDWNRLSDVVLQLEREVVEFKDVALKKRNVMSAAVARAAMEDELGDVLFSIVNCFRHLEMDPEIALHRATDKFTQRYQQMKDLAGNGFESLSMEEKEGLWKRVKASAG